MKKDKNTLLNQFATGLSALLALMTIVFVVLLMKYAAVSLTLTLLIALALFAIVGLVVLGVVFSVNNSHVLIRNIALGVTLILTVIVGYGMYYLYSVNTSVDQIIVDGSEKETVTVAFVVYDNKTLMDVDDIEASNKFGYINNVAFNEGNVLALEEIANKSIDAELVPYDTYNDLILGLFNKEIDIAALPNNYNEMFSENDGYQEYLDKTTIIHSYSKEVDTNGVDVVSKDITKEPFSLLIMGVDEKRADAIILATFNPQRMVVTMTNIARDSFVPISCYRNNQSDKINHARAVSRSCLIETVEDLMDTDIDFFVEVNFKGVVDIVDALGGLWLSSPVEFIGQSSSYDRGTYNVWVGEGYQQMDGEQVLAFARERHSMPDADFTRQANQKYIITELVSTLLATNDANKVLSVLKAAGINISTNLSLNQMTQLLNFGFEALNDTYVGKRNGSLIFNFISTGLVGYASSTYNEGLQLPLWIYKPYQGSIKDNVAIINRNLEITKTLKEYYKADFDIWFPHYEPTSYVPDTYDEVKVHEKLPDYMPKMVHGDKVWTLEMVNEWHNSRTSVNLTFKPIVAGDPLYNDAYQHHQVVDQSVRYGIKISNITSLEISYIQKDLDCSIPDNQGYFECSDNYVVPYFIGQSRASIDSWIAAHPNKSVNIVNVDNTSNISGVVYDKQMSGKIGQQSAAQYTKWDSIGNSITVYYFDTYKIKLNVSAVMALNGETSVKNWFTTNGWTAPSINTVFDPSAVGTVISVKLSNSAESLTTDDKYYDSDQKFNVTISKGSDVSKPLPDFTGMSIANVEAYMSEVGLSSAGVIKVMIDRPEGIDETYVGKIAEQSVPAGTTNYQLIKAMEIKIYQ